MMADKEHLNCAKDEHLLSVGFGCGTWIVSIATSLSLEC